MHITTLNLCLPIHNLVQFDTVMLVFQFSFILCTLTIHSYMIDVQANITIFNPAADGANVIWTEHFPHTVPPAPVQVTAAPTADGIAVSWRWNDYSVLTCVRSIKIVYQPVGSNEERFDIQKSKTTYTLRNRQCNMGCVIIVKSLDLNGSVTNSTACTTSGRTQIIILWSKHCSSAFSINKVTCSCYMHVLI